MRSIKFKQCACISEASAAAFQNAINAILQQTPEPEIVIDKTQPFTAYIFYKVSKDAPETVLELLEMLDEDGGCAQCQDCPEFIRSTDKRRKWGKCRRKNEPTRTDSRACELYYLARRREAERIAEEFKQIPYAIE